jgi:hypothetical protein
MMAESPFIGQASFGHLLETRGPVVAAAGGAVRASWMMHSGFHRQIGIVFAR